MINFASTPKWYLVTGYTDLRKGIGDLAAIIKNSTSQWLPLVNVLL